MMKNACENCENKGLRCYNANSPCYLHFCGEYPGTGHAPKKKEEGDKPQSR